MKKARNERFNKLRYLCFIGIIAFGLNKSLDSASSEGLIGAESEESGELRYFTLESEKDSNIIIVAVLNSNRRNIDYMPLNHCTSDGGGNSAFLNFLVRELVPYLFHPDRRHRSGRFYR